MPGWQKPDLRRTGQVSKFTSGCVCFKELWLVHNSCKHRPLMERNYSGAHHQDMMWNGTLPCFQVGRKRPPRLGHGKKSFNRRSSTWGDKGNATCQKWEQGTPGSQHTQNQFTKYQISWMGSLLQIRRKSLKKIIVTFMANIWTLSLEQEAGLLPACGSVAVSRERWQASS